jgi:spermidine/putrescine transport system permease protein
LLGFPIAYYIAKIAGQPGPGRLFLMCLIPLWVSDLIRAFGWILLLRETGVISSFLLWAGMIGTADRVPLQRRRGDYRSGLHGHPVHDRTAGFDARRHGQFDDRGGLQSRRQRPTVLRKIIMPYAMPGIVAGCIVTFMLTAGSYLTPILLGGKNSSWFTEQIYDQFITRYNWESGAAFGFLLLAVHIAGGLGSV